MAQTRAKPPISSHGLFPAIVAIWFAALFGFGCLVLPLALLEHLSDASGIAALLPAAAPPLGLTARIALSSGAGVFGALAGFAIARRVAETQAKARPADPDRQLRFAQDVPAERVRRPISASEELGIERIEPTAEDLPVIAAPSPVQERKRPLVMPEAPVPAHFLPIPPENGQPAHWADEHPLMPSVAAMMEKTIAPHDREQRPDPVATPPVDEPAADGFDTLQADDEAEQELPAPAIPVAADASIEDGAPLAEAPPDQRRIVRKRPPASALTEPLRALLAGRAAPADKIAGPLELLGMVQLAERLGRSIQEHGSSTAPQPKDPAAAPANGVAPANGTAASAPGFARLAALAESVDDGDDDETDEDAAAGSYSSLLAIGNPVSAETYENARAFDAPAQLSERLTRSDPAETERALRSALATLQRMSGAA